jgi:hypothetical protein
MSHTADTTKADIETDIQTIYKYTRDADQNREAIPTVEQYWPEYRPNLDKVSLRCMWIVARESRCKERDTTYMYVR